MPPNCRRNDRESVPGAETAFAGELQTALAQILSEGSVGEGSGASAAPLYDSGAGVGGGESVADSKRSASSTTVFRG